MAQTITYRVGFDVAKSVFQVHGVKNEPGEAVAITRRLRRAQVEPFFAKLKERHSAEVIWQFVEALGARHSCRRRFVRTIGR